jgi:hypothetical protein
MSAKNVWTAKAAAFAAAFLVAGVTTASLVAAGADKSSNPTPAAKDDRVLNAKAIADELHLQVLEPPANLETGSCKWAVDVDEVIYCLDSAASTEAEASAIVAEMRGSAPSTDAETAWWNAAMAYKDAEEALADAERSGTPEEIERAREAVVQASVDLHIAAVALDGGG